MTISAIEDYEDIARRLKEIKPESVKVEPETLIVEKSVEIDWSFFNGGMDGA